MTGRLDTIVDTLWSTQWLPYVLVGLGLLLGLVVLLLEPFAWPPLNLLVGGGLLAVAAGSVTFLIARYGGPDKRRPNF